MMSEQERAQKNIKPKVKVLQNNDEDFTVVETKTKEKRSEEKNRSKERHKSKACLSKSRLYVETKFETRTESHFEKSPGVSGFSALACAIIPDKSSRMGTKARTRTMKNRRKWAHTISKQLEENKHDVEEGRTLAATRSRRRRNLRKQKTEVENSPLTEKCQQALNPNKAEESRKVDLPTSKSSKSAESKKVTFAETCSYRTYEPSDSWQSSDLDTPQSTYRKPGNQFSFNLSKKAETNFKYDSARIIRKTQYANISSNDWPRTHSFLRRPSRNTKNFSTILCPVSADWRKSILKGKSENPKQDFNFTGYPNPPSKTTRYEPKGYLRKQESCRPIAKDNFRSTACQPFNFRTSGYYKTNNARSYNYNHETTVSYSAAIRPIARDDSRSTACQPFNFRTSGHYKTNNARSYNHGTTVSYSAAINRYKSCLDRR